MGPSPQRAPTAPAPDDTDGEHPVGGVIRLMTDEPVELEPTAARRALGSRGRLLAWVLPAGLLAGLALLLIARRR